MLANGDEEESDEENDKSTLMAESLKQTELREIPKQAEPEVGTGNIASDVGKQGPVKCIASQ